MSHRSIATALCAALASAAAGCSGEFALGDEPRALELLSGDYQLSIGEQTRIECKGSKAGHEAEFSGIDAKTAGLVGGLVDVDVGVYSVALSGAPIRDGFGEDVLELATDPLDAADDTLVASTRIDRDGVGDTRALVGTLGLAPEDAVPSHAEGEASICYSPAPDEVSDHACVLWFAVSLEAPTPLIE